MGDGGVQSHEHMTNNDQTNEQVNNANNQQNNFNIITAKRKRTSNSYLSMKDPKKPKDATQNPSVVKISNRFTPLAPLNNDIEMDGSEEESIHEDDDNQDNQNPANKHKQTKKTVKPPPLVVHVNVQSHAKFLQAIRDQIKDVKLSQLETNARYLGSTKVSWDYYRNKRKITQCHNCQEWGHATSNCFAEPACLKCAGNHLTSTCVKTRETPVHCVNSGGAHPANFIDCPTYKNIISKTQNNQNQKSKKKFAHPSSDISNVQHFPPMNKPANGGVANMHSNGTSNNRHQINRDQFQIHPSATNQNQTADIISLANEIQEIEQICDINEMLSLVKDLKQKLLKCRNKTQQFEVFVNFSFTIGVPKICSCNSNGLKNKIGEVIEFLDRMSIDLFLIHETRLNSTDRIKIKNYSIIRRDKTSAAGGIAILCLVIKLTSQLYVVSAYCSPQVKFTAKDLDNIFNIGEKVLLIGDLNARHRTWNCHRINPRGTVLYNYSLKNNYCVQFTDKPTHYPTNNMTPTTIDIYVNKNVSQASELKVLDELNSGHNPIILSLGN
ncbi:Similar to X-element\ORF2: Probable RNA-directed DNA polymerase from transposon X-element (Drosophila melanogaster), partial [Cotesia congregata]